MPVLGRHWGRSAAPWRYRGSAAGRRAHPLFGCASSGPKKQYAEQSSRTCPLLQRLSFVASFGCKTKTLARNEHRWRHSLSRAMVRCPSCLVLMFATASGSGAFGCLSTPALRCPDWVRDLVMPASSRPSMSASVVIAALNAASTIARSILSALPDRNVSEVIVVDDGSTDGTVDIATRVADGNRKLRVIRLAATRGPAHARNR